MHTNCYHGLLKFVSHVCVCLRTSAYRSGCGYQHNNLVAATSIQSACTNAPHELDDCGAVSPLCTQVTVTFSPEVAFPYYKATTRLMVPGMQDICWGLQVCHHTIAATSTSSLIHSVTHSCMHACIYSFMHPACVCPDGQLTTPLSYCVFLLYKFLTFCVSDELRRTRCADTVSKVSNVHR